MILILTIYGKLNFLQFGRHGRSCESHFRQNFKKEFDWCGFNVRMCLYSDRKRGAIAHDHSFLSKFGKHTPGLGFYWSGCAGAVKRGLEILGFAYVEPGVDDARFLFAEQTITTATRGRAPSYLEHMKDNRDNQTARCLRTVFVKREQLNALSNVVVGDCLFATYNFVTGIRKIGFEVVSIFRDDAVLHYIYTGPQKRGRGRRKELDGQVDINNLKEDKFSKESLLVTARKCVSSAQQSKANPSR